MSRPSGHTHIRHQDPQFPDRGSNLCSPSRCASTSRQVPRTVEEPRLQGLHPANLLHGPQGSKYHHTEESQHPPQTLTFTTYVYPTIQYYTVLASVKCSDCCNIHWFCHIFFFRSTCSPLLLFAYVCRFFCQVFSHSPCWWVFSLGITVGHCIPKYYNNVTGPRHPSSHATDVLSAFLLSQSSWIGLLGGFPWAVPSRAVLHRPIPWFR